MNPVKSDVNRAPVAFTYASEDNYHLPRLVTSVAHHGIDLRVLGMGVPWQTLLQKPEALLSAASALPEE